MSLTRKSGVVSVLIVAAVLIGGAVTSAQFSGPSSSQSPYLVPALAVVKTTSIE